MIGKTELSVLEIELHHEWIYKFSFESPTGGNPTLILPTLPIQKVPKKASKILQKCNSYFEQLFLDLNVSTDIPTAKRIIRNQIYFVFVIRNIGLRCKDGKWNSWILLNQLLNHNFWQILVIMYIGPQHKKGLTFKL